MKYEIDLDVPEGFEPTGEFRRAMKNEYFLDGNDVQIQDSITVGSYPILRKLEPTGEQLVGKWCKCWDVDDESNYTVQRLTCVYANHSYPYHTEFECYQNARLLTQYDLDQIKLG